MYRKIQGSILREVKFLEICCLDLSTQESTSSTLFSVSGNFLSRTITFCSILWCFLVWPPLNLSSLLGHVSCFYNTPWCFLLPSHLSIELVLISSNHAHLNIIWELNNNRSQNILACSGIWPRCTPATLEKGLIAERHAQVSHYTDLMSFIKYTQVLNSLASSLCHALAKDFITFFVHLRSHQISHLILVSFPLIGIREGFY